MANTKIPVELSSTPGIVDNSNATAITIDSSENVTMAGDIVLGAGKAIKFNDDRFFMPENNVDGAEISANGIFKVKTGSTPIERLRVNASGNVGIGTSSPDTKLHVHKGSAGSVTALSDSSLVIENSTHNYLTFLSPNNVENAIIFGDSDSNNVASLGYNHSSNHMGFSTNNAERMRIDSSGSLFIGTTSEATGSTGGVTFSADSHGRRNLICASTTTGGVELIEFRNPNGTVGYIATSGSSTVYNTSSDYRLKENVNYDFTALDRVAQLKPARFNFIADEDTTVDGFIAHEVQDIVPEAITGEKDAVDSDGNPDYQGIDQSKLVPLLTKAIQEQQTQIDALQSEINLLKGE